jgi:hypothetical protein
MMFTLAVTTTPRTKLNAPLTELIDNSGNLHRTNVTMNATNLLNSPLPKLKIIITLNKSVKRLNESPFIENYEKLMNEAHSTKTRVSSPATRRIKIA